MSCNRQNPTPPDHKVVRVLVEQAGVIRAVIFLALVNVPLYREGKPSSGHCGASVGAFLDPQPPRSLQASGRKLEYY